MKYVTSVLSDWTQSSEIMGYQLWVLTISLYHCLSERVASCCRMMLL